MKKKIIFSIGLIVLICFVIFVNAQENKRSLRLEKGWNLVGGFNNDFQINSNSEIKIENIKAIYSYFTPASQYVRLYPNPENEKIDQLENLYQTDDDILLYVANWVYSDKAGLLSYDADSPKLYGAYDSSGYAVYEGWNFVHITEEMIESSANSIYSIGDLEGTCNIQKSYVWDVDKQEWLAAPLDSFDFGIDAVGFGWVIKVPDNCMLVAKQ